MDISQEHKKEIEKLIAGSQCPKNFKCYKSEIKDICKAKYMALNGYVECLEKKSESCIYEITNEGVYYCRCPIRVYVAKVLNK